MRLLSLLTPLLFALPTTHSLFILLPLYLYPDDSASAWTNVTAAIAAYSTVQWQVIVNPENGPGTTASQPSDPNYITAISKLNGYANVKTLGYVDTKYTQRAYSAVTSDIDVYASWASYTDADISIDGIFFDDVNNTASNPAMAAVSTYMRNASAHAYDTLPSTVTPVVFNPGSLAPTTLFDYCDTMVEFERAFADYDDDATIATIPSGYRNRSAIVVYSTPGTADVQSLVHTMAADGLEAVFFGTDCCYNSFDAAMLMQLAAAVNAG